MGFMSGAEQQCDLGNMIISDHAWPRFDSAVRMCVCARVWCFGQLNTDNDKLHGYK